MKQKLFLSIAALAGVVLTSSAQSEKTLTVNAGQMENIVVSSDMHVVLISASSNEASFSMSAEAAESLSVKLTGNTLQISPGTGNTNTVYLSVSNLKTLKVESNSQVETLGTLNAPLVQVYVDGKSKAHLRTNGIINAYGLNDAEARIKYRYPDPLAKR